MDSKDKASTAQHEQDIQVLIVEDDRDLRESLAQYLARQHFTVTQAAHVLDGRRHVLRRRFDVVVLDIMMPGEDGLSFCRHIRGSVDIPVILISAKGDDLDRIVGLEIGADDYIAKPFNPRELLARLKAVVRRARSTPKLHRLPNVRAFQFGEWLLRTAERELVGSDGVTTQLSTGEFRLLLQFLLQPKTLLTRERLLDATQGREAGPFDRTIDNQIARLRRKIEPDNRTPSHIKTVWGGGYMLTVDVQQQ